MPFYWTGSHQKAFEQVKELLIKPPVLHLPRPGGRFILYCDTSKTHTGSSLWQMQDGKPSASFNALAQYRLAMDHITESFMISNFMVATRSSTSAGRYKVIPSAWSTERCRLRP